jgi:hypothetical protein
VENEECLLSFLFPEPEMEKDPERVEFIETALRPVMEYYAYMLP